MYPEVSIFLRDKMNPSCGYQIRIVNGQTGEELLYTGAHPITGENLQSYQMCLDAASKYVCESSNLEEV